MLRRRLLCCNQHQQYLCTYLTYVPRYRYATRMAVTEQREAEPNMNSSAASRSNIPIRPFILYRVLIRR